MIKAVLLAAAVLAAWPLHAQDPRASLVGNVAREWLAIVDRGDAEASHAKAGGRFREAMSVTTWARGLAKERGVRGALVQRTNVSTTFDPKVEGLPPGEFALLLFRTSFAQQPDAAETVTLEREKDGAWRVVGYFIR